MNKGYLEFCNKYKKKLVNDKEISERKEGKVEPYDDITDRINFRVNMTRAAPGYEVLGINNGDDFFILDQEDLDYLYAKYSKRLNEEMEKNIQEVRDQYKTEKV
jgi:hypothetical protein